MIKIKIIVIEKYILLIIKDDNNYNIENKYSIILLI